jgi:hypothetical protein
MSCNLTIQSLTAAGATFQDIANGSCGCGLPFRDHPPGTTTTWTRIGMVLNSFQF